jgi:hypothetical protein
LFPHPDAGPLLNAVGRLTEFTGLAGIDFIWERDTDRLLLLEFNPRPTPVYYLGHRAGVDFARALREMASGPATIQAPNLSSKVIDLFPQMLYYSVMEGPGPDGREIPALRDPLHPELAQGKNKELTLSTLAQERVKSYNNCTVIYL